MRKRPTIIGAVVALCGFYLFFGYGLEVHPVIFSAILVLLVVAILTGWSGKARRLMLRRSKEYAENPWRIRADWAVGTVRDGIRKKVFAAWSLAIAAVLGVAFVANLASNQEGLDTGSRILLGLFHVGALAAVVAAVVLTTRLLRFGVAECALLETPGVLGGRLSAIIFTGKRIVEPGEFTVKIEAIHQYISGSGKNAQSHRRVLWSDRTKTAEEVDAGTFRKNAIPVDFALPFDLPASNSDDHRSRYQWLLSVERPLPGMHFRAAFEVPVFPTAASNPAQTEAALEAARSSAADTRLSAHGSCLTPEQREVMAASGIDVLEDRPAHLDLVFRGWGNWKRFAPGVAFGSVILVVAAAIWDFGLPGIIVLGMVVLGMASLWVSAYLLMARLALSVTHEGIEVRRRRFIFHSHVSVAAVDVLRVDACEPYALNGVPFFRLRAHCRNRHRPLKLLPALSDREIVRRIGRRIDAILKRPVTSPVPLT